MKYVTTMILVIIQSSLCFCTENNSEANTQSQESKIIAGKIASLSISDNPTTKSIQYSFEIGNITITKPDNDAKTLHLTTMCYLLGLDEDNKYLIQQSKSSKPISGLISSGISANGRYDSGVKPGTYCLMLLFTASLDNGEKIIVDTKYIPVTIPVK